MFKYIHNKISFYDKYTICDVNLYLIPKPDLLVNIKTNNLIELFNFIDGEITLVKYNL